MIYRHGAEHNSFLTGGRQLTPSDRRLLAAVEQRPLLAGRKRDASDAGVQVVVEPIEVGEEDVDPHVPTASRGGTLLSRTTRALKKTQSWW